MVTPVRTLLAAVALLAVGAVVASAQTAPPSASAAPSTRPTLEFLGFRPGQPLYQISRRVRELQGSALRCDRARVDPRVADCRALATDSMGGSFAVWLSAIDSLAGIITISRTSTGLDPDPWLASLRGAYGTADSSVQGTQVMMEWIRDGRMLRITWRTDGDSRTTSVSLVDGRVLDAWGRGLGPRLLRKGPPPGNPRLPDNPAAPPVPPGQPDSSTR